MKRILAVAGTTTATLGLLLGVNTVADSATPPAPKAVPVITISNFAFTGALRVNPGVKVKVVNSDAFAHTFTNPAGRFDTGTIAAGKSKTFIVPTKLGNYRIRCNIHASMKGTLHVVAP